MGLSNYCLNLTNITQEQIDRASSFPDVAEEFQEWIDIFGDDYILCSWGSFDKNILIADCELHRMDDLWVDPYLNIRRQYTRMKRLKGNQGLKYTVEKEGFEFTGENHRAIVDAENLAKIFIKYIDEWEY